MKTTTLRVLVILSQAATVAPALGPTGTPPINTQREWLRSSSAAAPAHPVIHTVKVNGTTVWADSQLTPVQLKPGDQVALLGEGFGFGPDIDFAKVLIGTVRATERDLTMYRGTVNLLQQLFYEDTTPFDEWKASLSAWTDGEVDFVVPVTATRGPLQIQIQKRTGNNPSLVTPGTPHSIWDPLTERIQGTFAHLYDVVSRLGAPVLSNEIPLVVNNPGFKAQAQLGEAIYWAYEFNMGLVHHLRKMDWEKTLRGQGVNPLTGQPISAENAIGAIPTKAGEVPAVALQSVHFDPFPSPMPIKPPLGKALTSGNTYPTGYVGYVYADSNAPLEGKGKWVGFSCVSCHSQRITYEAAPGQIVSKVVPGLPNPHWSMKWNVLGGMNSVRESEPGPAGTAGCQDATVDKSLLLWSVPEGGGEHSLVRHPADGSQYGNDYLFSPIAIPIITRHTPVRRALSHTEFYAGFEGSYVHAEEPDGAIGALWSDSLKALASYMTTLDENDGWLERVGLYRWLKRTGSLSDVSQVGEGVFVQTGKEQYPPLMARVRRGEQVFGRDCRSCHQANFGTYSNEDMFSFSEVGSYFSPTIYHLKNQSIRTAILRNLAWIEPRGLLHDGHVKSFEDLVHPDRCQPGTQLYQQYYTLHSQSFHVPKGNAEQELALRRHAYFVDVPWDTRNLYWDYQAMRTHFGPREVGAQAAVSLPAAPHPWCTQDPADVEDLVAYLMTL